jgi:transposase
MRRCATWCAPPRRGAGIAPGAPAALGFLLRQGCHYGRPAWTKLRRRWLAGLTFEQAVHHIVLEDYIEAVEAAEARRDRLTAQIEAMLPDWTLAPVVAALQTMRGMALVNAATLIAELGDLSRFANPRQLMAYLGLVPSEHSVPASNAAASPRPATARRAGC